MKPHDHSETDSLAIEPKAGPGAQAREAVRRLHAGLDDHGGVVGFDIGRSLARTRQGPPDDAKDSSPLVALDGPCGPGGACRPLRPRLAGPRPRQGKVRHQLACRPGSRRLLSGGRRRHLHEYGLDVTIIPGGPQANGALLLLFGKIEFFMGGDMIGNYLSVEGKLPLIAVAADFQKSPQILMSHPGQGLDRWADLPKANARLCRRRRDPDLLRLAQDRLRLQGREHKALQFQFRPLHRQQGLRPSRAMSRPSPTRSRSRAISSPTCSCFPTTATTPIRP